MLWESQWNSTQGREKDQLSPVISSWGLVAPPSLQLIAVQWSLSKIELAGAGDDREEEERLSFVSDSCPHQSTCSGALLLFFSKKAILPLNSHPRSQMLQMSLGSVRN